MKVIILISFLFSNNFAQVIKQTSGTNWSLYSVFFVNDSIGFVSGDAGTILKTTDGGENWNLTILDTTTTLRDIFFINSKIGFAVGDFTRFYKTTDGGNSWNFIANELSDIGSVWFIDSLNGWVTSNYSMAGIEDGLYTTTNGGLIWSKQKNGWYDGLYFIDSLGFCVSSDGRALKTTDSGVSWNEFICDNNVVLRRVFFPTTNIGYIISGETWLPKRIYKSTDSGETWINKWQRNDNSSLNSIWFFNRNQGIVCGATNDYKGRLIITNDGGNSWQEIDTFENILNDIYFVNDSLGWTVGANGSIYKLENPIVVNVNESLPKKNKKELSLKVYPNPFNNQTTLRFSLPNNSNVEIILFNILGEKVAELLNEYKQAGEYNILFRANNFVSGIYYLLIMQNSYRDVKKIVLLK